MTVCFSCWSAIISLCINIEAGFFVSLREPRWETVLSWWKALQPTVCTADWQSTWVTSSRFDWLTGGGRLSNRKVNRLSARRQINRLIFWLNWLANRSLTRTWLADVTHLGWASWAREVANAELLMLLRQLERKKMGKKEGQLLEYFSSFKKTSDEYVCVCLGCRQTVIITSNCQHNTAGWRGLLGGTSGWCECALVHIPFA